MFVTVPMKIYNSLPIITQLLFLQQFRAIHDQRCLGTIGAIPRWLGKGIRNVNFRAVGAEQSYQQRPHFLVLK
jgi:hypothetical protein